MNSETKHPFPQTLLDTLALVGPVSLDELATLLGDVQPTIDLQILTLESDICRVEDQFYMNPELVQPRLDAFQRRDPVHFIDLFNRHATRLMQEDVAAFAQLIERISPLQMLSSDAQQLLSYFQAVLLSRQDRYDDAIEKLDRLLSQSTLDAELRGRALNSQSIYLQLTGQIERAVTGYSAVLALWRSLGNRTREGMALLNLGILHYQLQHYEQAESHLLLAGECFLDTQNEYQLASVQNQLGLLYRDQGLLEEAFTCFDAVAAHRRANLDDESLGRALNNRGEVLLFQGKWDAAEVDFVEALGKLQSRTFAVDAHLNLGLSRQVRGDLDGARQLYQRALDIALEIGRRDILAEIHYHLGDVQQRLGEGQAALLQLEAAAAVVEASQGDIRSEALRIGLLGRWQQIYEALVLHCFRIGDWQRAFYWAERARARAFADALASAVALPEAENESPDIVIALLRQLSGKSVLWSYFTIGVLEQEMPFLAAIQRDNPLRQHLLLPPVTLCFEFRNQQLRVHDCKLDPNALVTLSPRQDRSRLLMPAVLKRLYAQLIPSVGIDDGIDASTDESTQVTQIFIAPHGPLHQIPFAALINAEGQPLLRSDQAPLLYTPSGTILLQRLTMPHPKSHPKSHPAAGSLKSCIAVGWDSAGDWGSLRHTEREAMLIAALCNGQSLTGNRSKLTALRRDAGQMRWLHFACHGWFDAQKPLDSYLQVAENEQLSAKEVLTDWRLNAELVTLSACQSGVQKLLRSDEPMGLVRGFLYAGARSVLATQWPVEDLPTFLLMLHFYHQLVREGSLPALALRNSQCWLRSLTDAEVQQLTAQLPNNVDEIPAGELPFAHPRFWAGFVLYG